LETAAENVIEKCFIIRKRSSIDIDDWTDSGEFRFYYHREYNPETEDMSELGEEAKRYGKDQGKVDFPFLTSCLKKLNCYVNVTGH